MGLEIAGVWLPNSFQRHTCNCVLWHYMQNLKKKNNTVTFDELMLKALIFVLFWTLRPQFVSQVPVA